jgi:hypothetical protein
MVDIQTVSIVIASASVMAGVLYYIFQIRHQTKMRQTDLIMRLYSTLGSKEFVENDPKIFNQEFKDLEGFLQKYSSFSKFMESSDYAPFMMDSMFFEGVGILLYRKLVDIELVDDLFSSPIITIWEKTKPMTEALRKHFDRPQIAEWFEYLYNEMKKREQKLQQSAAKGE